MDSMQQMDLVIRLIRNVAMAGVVLFFVVGLDLVMGGRVMMSLGKIFNRRFDMDKRVLDGLSGFRGAAENEVMDVEEALAQARARRIMGVLLLIPAVLLVVLVLTRR